MNSSLRVQKYTFNHIHTISHISTRQLVSFVLVWSPTVRDAGLSAQVLHITWGPLGSQISQMTPCTVKAAANRSNHFFSQTPHPKHKSQSFIEIDEAFATPVAALSKVQAFKIVQTCWSNHVKGLVHTCSMSSAKCGSPVLWASVYFLGPRLSMAYGRRFTATGHSKSHAIRARIESLTS